MPKAHGLPPPERLSQKKKYPALGTGRVAIQVKIKRSSEFASSLDSTSPLGTVILGGLVLVYF
jgi:hypothetical protein